MRMFLQRFGKTLVGASMAVLLFAGMAVGNAAALGGADPTPPPPSGPLSGLRLEVAWARLQAGHDRAAVMFQFAHQRKADVQKLIDQAKSSGKDVGALQSALDGLEGAVEQAQPIFDSTTAMFSAHPGFDSTGRVSDPATALQTVTDLAAKDKQIQGIVTPAQQAFQQALQAFRQSGGLSSNTTAGSDMKIELAWARLEADHSRLQALFDFADQRMADALQLIDAAKARGKDVTSIQTALNTLDAAIKRARPTFEGTNGMIASHPGFDSSGNVTDATQALQTVKALGRSYQQIGSILKPAEQAFQQALQQFRQQNVPRPAPTPSG